MQDPSGPAVATLLSALIAATALGNALVCVSVPLVRRLRFRPANYLLMSLAVSDLCVAVLVMPPALHLQLTGRWTLGRRLCDLWVAMDLTCCTASILHLCAVAVDRYLSISRPLVYRTGKGHVRLAIAGVWAGAALVSVPPTVALGNEYGDEAEPRCDVSQNTAYQLYATLGAFYIPLAVLLLTYGKIHVAARNIVLADARCGPPVAPAPVGAPGARRSGSKRRRKRLRERKASFTLGVILAAFTVCWLPFFVVALVKSLSNVVVPPVWQSLVLWLGYANSMLNPVIYVTFHKDFRNAFREILCCRCRTVNQVFRREEARCHAALPSPPPPQHNQHPHHPPD